MGETAYFESRSILAPKNTIVDQINDYVLDLIPGEVTRWTTSTRLNFSTPLLR